MKNSLHLLAEMLTYRRPAWSRTEEEFIARYIDSIPGMRSDEYGNRILRVGESSTMFSCHTDTVHSLGGRQHVRYNWKTATYALAETQKRKHQKLSGKRKVRECLGADDAAGVYALRCLIAARVQGVYVFHRAEECGGMGSAWIADNTLSLFDGIARCIALDRRGQTDIITHQMLGRCCSDAFAMELGNALFDANQSLDLRPCAFGSFTDSANYTDYVAECTNVSVGYRYEHSASEYIDVGYLEELIDALCSVDFEALGSYRTPGTTDKWRKWEEEDRQAIHVCALRCAVSPAECPVACARAYLDSYINVSDVHVTDTSDTLDVDIILESENWDSVTPEEDARLDSMLLSRYEYLLDD